MKLRQRQRAERVVLVKQSRTTFVCTSESTRFASKKYEQKQMNKIYLMKTRHRQWLSVSTYNSIWINFEYVVGPRRPTNNTSKTGETRQKRRYRIIALKAHNLCGAQLRMTVLFAIWSSLFILFSSQCWSNADVVKIDARKFFANGHSPCSSVLIILNFITSVWLSLQPVLIP